MHLLAPLFLSWGLVMACLQAASLFPRGIFKSPRWAPVCASFQVAFACLGFAFFVWVHLIADMSYTVVWGHSHQNLPMIYRIGASWSSPEGSLFLMTLGLTLWNFFCTRTSVTESPQRTRTWGFLGLMCASFWVLLVFVLNPFTRLNSPLPSGLGLNPLLQDPSLLIHPLLFLSGATGLAVPFCQALASEGPAPIHKSTLLPWSLLTLGLLTGSIWAFYELEWGGWWFWDPVENSALIPWLWTTGSLHFKKRPQGVPSFWTPDALFPLFPQAAFLSLLWGTTLARGGILSSVHSFSPGALCFQSLVIWATGWTLFSSVILLKSQKRTRPMGDSQWPLTRWIPILFSGVFAICVSVYTLLPLASGFLGAPIAAIEPSFYNATLLVLFVVPGLAMPWVTSRFQFHNPFPLILGTLGALLILATLPYLQTLKAFVCMGLALWMGLGSLVCFKQKNHIARGLAHLGIAICLGSVTFAHFGFTQNSAPLALGETLTLTPNRRLTLKDIIVEQTPSFERMQAILTLEGSRRTLTPETRFYRSPQVITCETATPLFWDFSGLYILIGDLGSDGKLWVQAAHYPALLGIWIGGLLIALGGLWAFALTFWNRKGLMK